MNAQRRTVTIAGASILGATAFVVSALRLEVPFFPLTYLKFDLAEVPDFLSYLLFGAQWGLLTALIHFLVLSAVSGNVLGASMKLAAVASMILGYWAFSPRRGGDGASSLAGFLGGAAVRILVMSVFNLLILWVLFPEWLTYAYALLRGFGLSVGSRFDALVWTVALTAIYNFIHTLLTVVVGLAVYRAVSRSVG